MNNSEIQIQFPKLGQWDEFTLTPIYQDACGYRPPARFNQVAALVGMGEDWQASQVWARRGQFYAPEEDDPMRTAETVDLTVEAVNPQGGRRVFTSRDYPAFVIMEPAAVEFFRFFTKDERV